MLFKSRTRFWQNNRNKIIAAIPIFFLVLLALWTIFNANMRSVKAQPLSTAAFATVKRNSANLREGPGTQYRVLGRSLKGATLPVTGKFVDEFGRVWYRVYLRAFGDAWVSDTVVTITPINADIPVVGFSQTTGIDSTPFLPTAIPVAPSSGSGGSNTNPNPPSNNNPPPQQQPPPPAPPPATTPEVNG